MDKAVERDLKLIYYEASIRDALYWLLDEDGWSPEDVRTRLNDIIDSIVSELEND